MILRRNADRGRAGRHVLHHHRVRADLRAVADDDRAEDLRASANDDAARRASDGACPCSSSYRRGSRRDRACMSSPISAVSPITTPMPWSMNTRRPIVAPGWISMPVIQRAKCDTNRAEPAQAGAPQPMRQPMDQQRVESRVTRDDLPGGLGRRVAVEHAGDIFTDAREHAPNPSKLRPLSET